MESQTCLAVSVLARAAAPFPLAASGLVSRWEAISFRMPRAFSTTSPVTAPSGISSMLTPDSSIEWMIVSSSNISSTSDRTPDSKVQSAVSVPALAALICDLLTVESSTKL